MRRPRRRPRWLLVAGALALAGALAATLTTALSDGVAPVEVSGPDIGEDVFAVRASVTPAQHSFGDRVVARLTVAVAADRVNPETIQLRTQFVPYTQLGPAVLERAVHGGVAVLQASYTLQCLEVECLGDGPEQRVTLRAATVRYLADGRGEQEIVDWPELTLRSRLTAADLGTALPWSYPGDLPEVSRRVAPGVATWLSIGLALLLVAAAGGGALVALSRWRASAGGGEAGADDEPVGAAQVLAALEPFLLTGGDDARTAADRASAVLIDLGRPDEARTARRIAWSRRSPAPGELAMLAATVRHAAATRESTE